MKLIFAGTPEFAALALQSLLTAGHSVSLVLTQPDRPAGRGMQSLPSPVKRLALEYGLALHQPASLKESASQEPLRNADADIMVVAAYGLILPQAVLDIPRLGCLNIHASLLPRWRGAAPIQRAIAAGDSETGITVMRMDARLDTGPTLLARMLPIHPNDTALTLHATLGRLGAEMIVETLARLENLATIAQPSEGATYAGKIDKREAALDWRRPAPELERQVRAFNPFPTATAIFAGVPLKIWSATLSDAAGAPGRVLEANGKGILVGCGSGSLRLTELQKPGGKRLAARDFLHGFAIAPGAAFSVD